MGRLTTGIRALDDLIGGLRLGDNVVWDVTGVSVDPLVVHFLRVSRDSPLVYISFHVSPLRSGAVIPAEAECTVHPATNGVRSSTMSPESVCCRGIVSDGGASKIGYPAMLRSLAWLQ